MLEQFRGDGFCDFPVVAKEADAVVYLHVVLEQCVLVAIIAVLGDLQGHGGSVEGDAPAPRLYQMVHGSKGTLVVVHHYAAGIHSRADAVVEHDGHAPLDELLEMLIVSTVLGL